MSECEKDIVITNNKMSLYRDAYPFLMPLKARIASEAQKIWKVNMAYIHLYWSSR